MTYTARPDSPAVVIDATAQIIGPESGELWTAYQAWLAAGNAPNPAPTPPAPTQQQLAAQVVSACSAMCEDVISQAAPDKAHQLAYLNAAGFLAGGSTPPMTEPPKNAFAALAAANNMTPEALASLVSAFASGSLILSISLATLQSACADATTSAQLAEALSSFEASIGSLVATVNAASPPRIIVAPASPSIPGVNS